jgi:hypothetical protein
MAVKLATEEGGDVFGLDCNHGCARQRLVDRSQVHLVSEDDVGRVLDLHQAPVEVVRERLRPLVDSRGSGDGLGVAADGLPQGLGPFRIVEDPDVAALEQ